MTTPHLSVVISTHKRPVQVREAIAAIVGQDYDGPIETLVVWDKTEPETELESTDDHRPVRVLSNDRTPGLPGSRNAGAHKAAAPVLGFCDDDDTWHETKARKQLELMERTGAPTVGCGITVVTPERSIPRPTTGSAVRYEDLIRTRVPEAYMGCAVVQRDAFFGPIGPMFEEIPGGYAEDYEWWLRAARHAPIPIVREGLFNLRWTGASYFRDGWRNMEDALEVVLERFPEFAEDRKGLARVLGQRAFATAAMGDRREALRLVAETLRNNPAEARAVLAGVVAAGADPDKVMALLNRFGRGI